jgi:hypothetical protein
LSGPSSESFVNFTGALTANSIPAPVDFDIFTVNVDTGLNGKDFIDVSGDFLNGTFVVGYSANADKSWSTPFTVAGLIDGPGVPEPSTWAMMLAGFGLLGFAATRKGKREARLAV